MLNIELSTIGIGMEAVSTRAVGHGFYERFQLDFVAGWAFNLISRIGGGAGRAA